jgi:hypothetical protein
VEVNGLLNLCNEYNLEENQEEKSRIFDRLLTSVRSFTRSVEAHIRIESRRGQTQRPKTEADIAFASIIVQERIATALEGIVDTYRAIVSTSWLPSGQAAVV